MFKGKLYVGGGFNGRDCLDTVEVYDPADDQWTVIQPLSTLRSGAAFVAFAGFVYVIGGFGGMNRLRTGWDLLFSPLFSVEERVFYNAYGFSDVQSTVAATIKIACQNVLIF